MFKFKPGDKVKRVRDFKQPGITFNPNKIYVVTIHKFPEGVFLHDVPSQLGGWSPEKFILVQPRGPYLSNQGTEINV